MKTIGLIGGMSWESTVTYYQIINEVIKDSPFLTKDMKFLSAYNVKVDGKNTVIIKLNEAFSGLRKNKEMFDGFTQSVARTISNNFPNIQGINIQIDGEAIIQ